MISLSFSGGSLVVKDPPANAGDVRDVVRKIRWRRDTLPTPIFLGFPGGSDCKESSCNEGDLGLLPGLGRSPGDGHGNLFHFLAWRIPRTEEPAGLQSIGSQKSQTRLEVT